MDHYRTLGVKRTATKHEVEKAYKKLALKCHPDKSDAPDAADRFRQLNEAYEVLKDKNKRETYDRFDLPEASSGSSHHRSHGDRHGRHHHDHDDDKTYSRKRYEESFYTGRSESYRREREHQDELDRIKAINKKLLEEANAKMKRNNSSKSDTRKESANRSNTGLYSHIMPELDDDEFEKLTLNRLRAAAGGD